MISALRLNITAKIFTSLISSLKHARPSGNSPVDFKPLVAPAGDSVLAGSLVTGTRCAGLARGQRTILVHFEMHSPAKRGSADRFVERITITLASSWQKRPATMLTCAGMLSGVPDARATTLSRVFGNWLIYKARPYCKPGRAVLNVTAVA